MGMRSEQEVFVSELLHKYHKHLVQRGVQLVRKHHREQAVFYQLLEGCLLTLAYRYEAGDQLAIRAWQFTDPCLN